MPLRCPAMPGSIPACAGEPPRHRRVCLPSKVYPRVCGGTSGPRHRTGHHRGLSPRVRGNLPAPVCWVWTGRSIPACAGEPRGIQGRRGGQGVYPRVCGGTARLAIMPSSTAGLSPRVRGNLTFLQTHTTDIRSIPACAGEPSISVLVARVTAVYPRVCGGTMDIAEPQVIQAGLSPRVRGNRPRRPPYARTGRSIPACAGEPAQGILGLARGKVYPRVCGGTVIGMVGQPAAGGLSPRVRGNPIGGRRSVGWDRSIPACAGEPG